ncbi:MAG: hypothetical protein AB7H88_09520 [Vicinamibacterales bacterium]
MAIYLLTAFTAALFSGLTGFVLVEHGYAGFVDWAMYNSATRLMLLDIVILATIVLGFIWRDARAAGRRFWPYAVLTAGFGSIGPLLYFLARGPRRRSGAAVASVAVTFGALALAAAPATAQTPTIWLVQELETEPSQLVAVEAAFADAATAASSGTWLTVQPYFAAGRFAVFVPLGEPALPMDEWSQAPGSDAILAAPIILPGSAIRSVARSVAVMVPELSYRPAAAGGTRQAPEFYHVGVDYVRPDRVAQYRTVIAEVRNALARLEHPHGFDVFRDVVGAHGLAYTFMWPSASAEVHYRDNQLPRLLLSALGPQKALDLGRRWRECLVRFEAYDLRPRPELSRMPAPAGAPR